MINEISLIIQTPFSIIDFSYLKFIHLMLTDFETCFSNLAFIFSNNLAQSKLGVLISKTIFIGCTGSKLLKVSELKAGYLQYLRFLIFCNQIAPARYRSLSLELRSLTTFNPPNSPLKYQRKSYLQIHFPKHYYRNTTILD